MQRRSTYLVGAAVAVPVLILAAVAALAGGDDELTGDTYDRAVAAALEHVGEGTVVETEVGDDGAAFEVEIQLDDGSQVEVNLDEDFEVISVEPDDD